MIHIHMSYFPGSFNVGVDSLPGAAGRVYSNELVVTNLAGLSEEVKDLKENLSRGVFLSFAAGSYQKRANRPLCQTNTLGDG